MNSRVFVFNPFAEGFIGRGRAFTPVKHQEKLAEDLENLPQFLGDREDVVVVRRLPSTQFLNSLERAGFTAPTFCELSNGEIDPVDGAWKGRKLVFRPWAWGPDSLRLFAPLLASGLSRAEPGDTYFNPRISRLYSKAWSADLLRRFLENGHAEGREWAGAPWLCSAQEVGVTAESPEEAEASVAAIRARGHHRVVLKEAYGLAGHNAIRLWEPEWLPAQREWLREACAGGRQVVVEPWLERELDFSVQLEMRADGLKLIGYTGLINDLKGQFLGNWAEPEYAFRLPRKAAALLADTPDLCGRPEKFYAGLFSWLQAELRQAGYAGPVSIDALVYRAPGGGCRLKPIVEINPRHTMGRLTLELMKRAAPGRVGLFRLVNRAQAAAEGSADLVSYARALAERVPLELEAGPPKPIQRGAVCLNDPGRAQVCLATFEVMPELPAAGAWKGRGC